MTGTVAQLVGRALAELGVGHAFGVVGSGNFHLTNALIAAGVPFTAARHENGAATMADAWARTSGRVAVVTTHQGCGLTNATTGIGEAAKSRTPLIVLTADTQAAAVHSNFRIDQDAHMLPLSLFFFLNTSPPLLSLLSTFLSLHYSYLTKLPPLMHLLSLFPSPSTS